MSRAQVHPEPSVFSEMIPDVSRRISSSHYLTAVYNEFNKQYDEFNRKYNNIDLDKADFIINWNNNKYNISKKLYENVFIIHLDKHLRPLITLPVLDVYKTGVVVIVLRYNQAENLFQFEFYSYDDDIKGLDEAKFENKWVYDELLILLFLIKKTYEITEFPPNNSKYKIHYIKIKGNERSYKRTLITEEKYIKEGISFKNYFKNLLINSENLTNKLSMSKQRLSSKQSCTNNACAIMGGRKK